MAPTTDCWVDIGVLGRAHGVRGALYARLLNADSDLLSEGLHLKVGRADDKTAISELPERVIRRARRTPKGWLVEFEGVGQREAAAALTNCKLYVARSALPELDPDEVYQADLVGFSVFDDAERELGRIIGFFDNSAHDVCVIRTRSGGEALLPFHEGTLLEVDLDGEVVVLDVPEGIPGLEDDASTADGS